ncbi:hypothetical protein E2C01_076102 [Portunus trituberculatus]|uniref:Uncharacterized protein n=1 Tax=Portunus trituberculatus TaxID=210409 RepID=A0A5B7IGZ2_PORTR|nr:hypothetical protein [Portunus trituberculatus]
MVSLNIDENLDQDERCIFPLRLSATDGSLWELSQCQLVSLFIDKNPDQEERQSDKIGLTLYCTEQYTRNESMPDAEKRKHSELEGEKQSHISLTI